MLKVISVKTGEVLDLEAELRRYRFLETAPTVDQDEEFKRLAQQGQEVLAEILTLKSLFGPKEALEFMTSLRLHQLRVAAYALADNQGVACLLHNRRKAWDCLRHLASTMVVEHEDRYIVEPECYERLWQKLQPPSQRRQ